MSLVSRNLGFCCGFPVFVKNFNEFLTLCRHSLEFWCKPWGMKFLPYCKNFHIRNFDGFATQCPFHSQLELYLCITSIVSKMYLINHSLTLLNLTLELKIYAILLPHLIHLEGLYYKIQGQCPPQKLLHVALILGKIHH